MLNLSNLLKSIRRPDNSLMFRQKCGGNSAISMHLPPPFQRAAQSQLIGIFKAAPRR